MTGKGYLTLAWNEGGHIAWLSHHDNETDANEAFADRKESSAFDGEYLAIVPTLAFHAPPETVVETEAKANPFIALDLRPSEMLVLAKEIAETSADQDDHQKIAWLREAYEATTGNEMACPYP